MSHTLCLLGVGENASSADAARELADTLGTEVAALHLVRHAGTAPPADVTIPLRQRVTADALTETVGVGSAADVACLVVGAGDRFPSASGDRPLIAELAPRVSVPLLVVPPGSALGRTAHLRRLLVPHDGSPRTSRRLHGLAAQLRAAGAELRVLHVLDPAVTGGLLPGGAYDLEAWRREFRLRHLDDQDSLTVRCGDPWERVRQEARRIDADAVVLAWGQHRSPGRAALIRAALADRSLPLLLVPDRPRGGGSSAPVADPVTTTP